MGRPRNLKVWATLGPVRQVDNPGDPSRVRISSGLTKIPAPPLTNMDVSPKKGFFRGEGRLFVYKEPHLGGNKWWLLASWFLLVKPGLPGIEEHELAVEEQEPADYEMRPLLRSVSFSSRWACSSIQFIDFTITREHMEDLAQDFGPPEEGNRFFTRLQPGRLPAGIRIMSPQHWQIWLKL